MRHKISCSVIIVSLTTSAFCYSHDYEKLNSTQGGKVYVSAIEQGRLYPVSPMSFNQLYEYYKDMKLKNKLEDKSRILNDKLFYSSIKDFSGEACAMLWRYENNKPHKFRAGGEDIQVQLNRTKIESTPFFDRLSPWYEKPYSITYQNKRNAYYHFFPSGNSFSPKHLGYAIHRSSALFGQGKGKKNDLVFSIQTYFLSVKDNNIQDTGTLIERDIALISPIYVPFTIGEIGRFSSEQHAVLECKSNAKFILPLWN
ncbi:hypothetical protein LRP52_48740 [Photobacterium sp. ZSDE20]|uniref:DUF4852 domain-containing protein n=1 Tax=Photobacterium pectinilyticum TaxID=2906793 RepID=A0ABT1N9A9_9GAMM|nr:hypothetical protein [Photobacterium sp. ZSDE20]MCQ1061340.1 hypothetical protein [Photobacterium sp. ZSDE20]MDD1830027.1 hypothetical protein [Photobacterium sp. ZSDE20]